VVVSETSVNERSLDELNRILADTGYRAIGPFSSHMIWKQYRYVEPDYSCYILVNTKKFSLPE